jgi:outer membrane protein assembly factor BamB
MHRSGGRLENVETPMVAREFSLDDHLVVLRWAFIRANNTDVFCRQGVRLPDKLFSPRVRFDAKRTLMLSLQALPAAVYGGMANHSGENVADVNRLGQHSPIRSWVKALSKYSLAIVILGSIGACTETVPFKHNAVSVLPMGSLERAWFVDLDTKSDPVNRIDVRDKMVYVYTDSKRVICYDRKAGTPQFTMQVKSPDINMRPLVELKDRLVFPTATSLEVYDNKGAFDKSIPLERPLQSDAAGENEMVYFGSAGPHGGLVEAYDVSAPYAPQRWEFLTHDGGNVSAGPTVYSGVVYSGSEGGEVDAVTVQRAQIWDTDHGNFLVYGPITADMKSDEAGLYIASRDTNLYCVNRTTGKLKWQYFAGSPLTESPVTTSDTVYQYIPGKGLAALDKIAGAFNRTPRWIHPTATQFLAEDEKYAYLADPHGSGYAIIAVDKQTMKQAFESDHKDFTVLGTNRGKDSLIYAGYADGKIFALQPVLKAGQIGELVMTTPPTGVKTYVTAAGL